MCVLCCEQQLKKLLSDPQLMAALKDRQSEGTSAGDDKEPADKE